MNRRNFLKLLAGTGLVSTLPVGMRAAQAAVVQPFNGMVLLTIHLGGGWDHSSFGDPRENSEVNAWAGSQVAGVAGNLRYAPMAENAGFFTKYHSYMLMLNGIDIQSNGHDAARRNRSSGRLAVGYPSINELYAAVNGQGLPMAYLHGGGFSETAGLLPYTSLPDEGLMRTLAEPNQRSATELYHKQSHLDIVRRYQRERLAAQEAKGDNLPRWKTKLHELSAARTANAELGLSGAALPDVLDGVDLMGRADNLIKQMHMFLVMMQSGLTVTGSLSVGGWDTHSNHDNGHSNALLRLTRGLDYLWSKAEGLGVADRLLVHVTSDVGRTPSYNNNNGKDHWSLGSDFLMQKNAAWGNRIVGISGPRHERLAINPQTLLEDSAGVRLQPKHIHAALRQLLGIDQHALVARFPLAAEALPIFEPGVQSGITV